MSGANSVHCSAAAIAFDRVADSYDELFTRTAIGRAQRGQVWAELLKTFREGDRILELNCGTGEDARFLAKQGRFVTACDASARMIEVARSHSSSDLVGGSIQYQQVANEELDLLSPNAPFDGLFSNFSGLNCVSDLSAFAKNAAPLVRPGGRILICLWSPICLSEIVWFLLQGEIRKAFRRFSKKSAARLGGLNIKVFYPSISHIKKSHSPWFRLEKRKAVGLFVPPSFVEPWAGRNEKALQRLDKLDRSFASWPILRDLGDHILMEFVRCAK